MAKTTSLDRHGIQPAIWVIGSTMMDMISYMRRVPRAGETLIGDRFALGFGGKGANQAVMAARLGAAVAMVNCLGTDVFGDMTVANFEREGIDVTYVTRTAGVSSGVAPIWVEPDGSNRIVCVAGANDRMRPEDAESAIAGASRVDLVLGQFEIPQEVTIAAFRAAKARGATTVLNPAPAAPPDPELLMATDWLVPNEVEFEELAREAVNGPQDPLDQRVLSEISTRLSVQLVVTLGERGAVHLLPNGELLQVFPPHVDVVDTTGAGDAFVGAFAHALSAGLGHEQAIRLGCACAADSVTCEGTQASFPTGDRLEQVRFWANARLPS